MLKAIIYKGCVLVDDTRSNNSRFSDTRFMHKLCLSLHAMNRVTGDTAFIALESLTMSLNNSNRA